MSVHTTHCKLCSSTSSSLISSLIAVLQSGLRPFNHSAFRNLRKLDFNADNYCIVRMDDAVFLQMAKAWPHLEELYISRETCSSHLVTPHAFVSLLWHCRSLVRVAVTIDWSTIDIHTIPPDIPYRGFSHNALSILWTGGSMIENPTSIAAFISAIAPNVRTMYGSEDYALDEDPPRWPIVQELLGTLPIGS